MQEKDYGKSAPGKICWQMLLNWDPYKSDERVVSVEKEEALKAGHWVEPFRGMQLCGAAAVINNAMAVRRAVEESDAISFALVVAPRELNTNEGFQNAQWLCLRAERGRSSAFLSKLPGTLAARGNFSWIS